MQLRLLFLRVAERQTRLLLACLISGTCAFVPAAFALDGPALDDWEGVDPAVSMVTAKPPATKPKPGPTTGSAKKCPSVDVLTCLCFSETGTNLTSDPEDLENYKKIIKRITDASACRMFEWGWLGQVACNKSACDAAKGGKPPSNWPPNSKRNWNLCKEAAQSAVNRCKQKSASPATAVSAANRSAGLVNSNFSEFSELTVAGTKESLDWKDSEVSVGAADTTLAGANSGGGEALHQITQRVAQLDELDCTYKHWFHNRDDQYHPPDGDNDPYNNSPPWCPRDVFDDPTTEKYCIPNATPPNPVCIICPRNVKGRDKKGPFDTGSCKNFIFS